MTRNAFDPAFLPSAGLNERRATLHTYSHSEKMSLPHPEHPKKNVVGIGHFYKCTETDTLRQWGFDRLAAEPEDN